MLLTYYFEEKNTEKINDDQENTATTKIKIRIVRTTTVLVELPTITVTFPLSAFTQLCTLAHFVSAAIIVTQNINAIKISAPRCSGVIWRMLNVIIHSHA